MKTQNNRKISWHMLTALSIIMALVSIMFSAMNLSTTAYAAGTHEFEVTSATSDFYINDFAGLFTDQQKSDMMDKAMALDKDYGGIQVVVTTVESLNDCCLDGKSHDIEEVSYAMYKQYGIGEDDMGILILFSTGDREVWMQTGYKMQTYITDSKSGQLLDKYGMDYFMNDQFAEGLVSLQNGTISEIKSVVPQDWNAPVVTPEPEKKTDNATAIGTSDANKTNNGTSKKADGIGGWLYGILAAFVAMIVGLCATIKNLFTSKSKAAAQKEKDAKELQKQKDSYEQRINSLKRESDENIRRAVNASENSWRASMESQKRSFDKDISILTDTIDLRDQNIKKLEAEVRDVTGVLRQTSRALEEYKDKYERIKALHPDVDFDKEVHEMIENEFRASAQKVDEKIAPCVTLPADKDNIGVFDEAIRTYTAQDAEVQKYITTDIQKLRSLYEESISLKREYERAEKEKRDRAAAQKAFEKIGAICQGISTGTHENYETLKRAYRIYTDLTRDEKSYYPDMGQIKTLESLQKAAEADMKDFNAASEAEKEVHGIVDRIYSADENDRDKLERALRHYKNLNSVQQAYFSQELARKVKNLLDAAEEDHRRKEAERRRRREEEERRRREEEERRRREEAERRRRREEEERRRRMSSSSSFSSSSHSSFGGHGGRPSGGGAGRHF